MLAYANPANFMRLSGRLTTIFIGRRKLRADGPVTKSKNGRRKEYRGFCVWADDTHRASFLPIASSILFFSPEFLAYDLDFWQWARAALAAVLIGMSKTGFNGISLLSIVLMADLLPARQSTGVILPMLLFADCFAVRSFRQHALWPEIRRVLPAALLGVVVGALIMRLFADPAGSRTHGSSGSSAASCSR